MMCLQHWKGSETAWKRSEKLPGDTDAGWKLAKQKANCASRVMLCQRCLFFLPLSSPAAPFLLSPLRPALNPSFSVTQPIIPAQRGLLPEWRCPCFWMSSCHPDFKSMSFYLLSSWRTRPMPGVAHHFMSSTERPAWCPVSPPTAQPMIKHLNDWHFMNWSCALTFFGGVRKHDWQLWPWKVGRWFLVQRLWLYSLSPSSQTYSLTLEKSLMSSRPPFCLFLSLKWGWQG